jgi:hypothetical protein
MMILLLDVYCRHRDKAFFAFLRDNCPYIIIIFVPANLTSLGQPLGVGFNFVFKRNVAQARVRRDMQRVVEYLAEHGNDVDIEELVHDHKLSEVRDPLVMDLLRTAVVWSTPAKEAEIKRDCWEPIGLLKCFTSEFQTQAVLAVGEDTEGKYFSKGVSTGAAGEGTGSGAGGGGATATTYTDPFQADLIEGSAAAGATGTEEGELFQMTYKGQLHFAVAVKWMPRKRVWQVGVLSKKWKRGDTASQYIRKLEFDKGQLAENRKETEGMEGVEGSGREREEESGSDGEYEGPVVAAAADDGLSQIRDIAEINAENRRATAQRKRKRTTGGAGASGITYGGA